MNEDTGARSTAPVATRRRPLALGPIRAFEAVARLSSFRAAADEMHLTQSAVSRQIRALEEEIGTVLFSRGTRHVELTGDGAALLRGLEPALERLDATVRQIRQSRGRRVVGLTTFASFSSLWLIPRLEAFQRQHPEIDIRVSASDAVVDLDDLPDLDLALRYGPPDMVPRDAPRLFGEHLTPAVSPWYVERTKSGELPALTCPGDLARHALAEEDDWRPSAGALSWRRWMTLQGVASLQPRRWMFLNFTHQQIQAALAGQAIALARMELVADMLARGELAEPFGLQGRIASPNAYWIVVSRHSQGRPEVKAFVDWVLAQAAETRRLLGEAPALAGAP